MYTRDVSYIASAFLARFPRTTRIGRIGRIGRVSLADFIKLIRGSRYTSARNYGSPPKRSAESVEVGKDCALRPGMLRISVTDNIRLEERRGRKEKPALLRAIAERTT